MKLPAVFWSGLCPLFCKGCVGIIYSVIKLLYNVIQGKQSVQFSSVQPPLLCYLTVHCMSVHSVVDVSHNRIDDPDVLEVFASMQNLVSYWTCITYM